MLDDECGVWHLANKGETTWSGLAMEVAKIGKLDINLLTPTPLADFNYAAKRPIYSVLGSEKALLMPNLKDSLYRYFSEEKQNNLLSEIVIETKAG
jgi:dTDP-4-dehydrorhamnose reductase